MKKRKLGRTGLEIAPLVFGGNVFGWTADQASSFALLDRFVEAGLNAVDTADVYSMWAPGNKGGESETIIGNWLKRSPARREKLLLITKVGRTRKACRRSGSQPRPKSRCAACKRIASTST
jgi:aryl-alcohol dehydrogenase-like predicted oxidoreductase